MKYFIIGDEDAVLGFGMVGVQGAVVEKDSDAEDAFHDALDDKDVGIIIITEKAADLIRPLVDDYIFSSRFPLILEIPDRQGRLPDKPGLREMVNNAIGIRL